MRADRIQEAAPANPFFGIPLRQFSRQNKKDRLTRRSRALRRPWPTSADSGADSGVSTRVAEGGLFGGGQSLPNTFIQHSKTINLYTAVYENYPKSI